MTRFVRVLALGAVVASGCGDNLDALPLDAGGNGDAGGDGGGGGDAGIDAIERQPLLNEYVIDLTLSDTHEYVEVIGTPNSDLSDLAILQIEASPSQNPGNIDLVFPVGTTNTTGHYVTDFQNAVFQNTSMTLMLVSDFTGAAGDDIDGDDDGVIDNEPWSAILDSVALDDGNGNPQNPDVFHSSVILPPNPSTGLIVSGASRIPDGTDTDSPDDWVQNDRDGSGLPCSSCMSAMAESGEANNTPGAPNTVEP